MQMLLEARGVRSSGAGSQVGAGNWTQVLYKSTLLSTAEPSF